tara:strand:- start:10148 stop:11056 length:909 start_codon:yes stop_codon:yes gene_type:complete
MVEKVLITGASGALAQRVKYFLLEKGYDVITLTTNKKKVNSKDVFYWNVSKKIVDPKALVNCSHIVHLSGYSIMKPWTTANKKLMYESRIDAVQLLYYSCNDLGVKPKTVISASAMGYYGIDSKELMSEDDAPTQDWLSQMCVDWEKATQSFQSLGSRVIHMRISLLLSKDSGFLQPTMLSMRLGASVVFGSGKQNIEWIHIDDASKFVCYAIENQSITGAYNLATEQKWTQYEFMKFVKRKVAFYALLIKLPSFVLRLIFGGRSVILEGGCALSVNKLKATNFEYDYPTLDSAIDKEMYKS